MRQRLLFLTILSALALSGCGHKPLKAPCARDEGPAQPMAYAALDPEEDAALKRACGPMRDVNGATTAISGWPAK